MPKNTPTKTRRTKGDGSLYYNEDKKVWVAQINDVDEETGQRIRKSVTGKTKAEAVSKMRAFMSGKEEAPKTKRTTAKAHKLYDFTMDYLNDFKKPTVTSRTFEWYRNISNHIRDGFGNRTIESLTALDIQRFFNGVASEKADNTVRYIHALLNQVLKHAVKQKIIPSNPIDDGVKRPKGQKTTQKGKALPRHVCRDMLTALDTSPTYKPLVITLLYTGLRIGELMALRYSNIDRDNMLLHIENAVTTECEFDIEGKTISRTAIVSDTKTAASQRVVPLEQAVLDVLDEWRGKSEKKQEKARQQGNGDLIFPNQFGHIRSYQSFQKQFKRFLVDNGLGDYGINFHKFRHTFATLLMEQGTNPRVVQELLGHKKVETTLGIYTTVSMGIKEKETGRLAATLAGIRTMSGADQRHNLIVAHG
ncbi:MAG: site-specific integrase [Oscillospiraceae bacterium]|jgi:integrase|nr:site-specific integrase [Oscillospiraceae bacterium]